MDVLRRDRLRARADRSRFPAVCLQAGSRRATITMMRLAKRNTTFMSCSMNSTEMSFESSAMTDEQLGALFRRHAGARARRAAALCGFDRQRQRDFQQALLAVGQFARRTIGSDRPAAAISGSRKLRRHRCDRTAAPSTRYRLPLLRSKIARSVTALPAPRGLETAC